MSEPEPLRVLVVEDSEDDELLLLRELRQGGFQVAHRRVQSAETMRAALEAERWDIVISDYSMPGFDAPAALAVLARSGLDLPFLIVSGTVGEETAVAALKAGANDFLSKQKLTRLVPAVRRELRERDDRAARRRAELALRDSEQRLRALTEAASDAIVSTDAGGAIVYANPASEQLFGYTAVELAGQPLGLLLGERSGEQGQVTELSDPAGLVAALRGHPGELVARRRDGADRPVELSLARWSSAGASYYTAIIRDVSERKRIEAQLMVNDRMASIGTLAAGIAHEINNPLAAMVVNLELVDDGFARQAAGAPAAGEELAELRAALADAREAMERVRMIVRDVKLFSRSEDETRDAVDVQQVLESTLRMAWNEVRHRARLVKQYQPVPAVRANQARLGQVFLNMVVNAAQAIPEGRADDHRITVSVRESGDGRVAVDIADTGSGMSRAVLRRLFTPFFTTKPAGSGTGLGLSICQRIVAAIGGEIRVDSEPGKGTTFTVLLPVAGEEAAIAPAPAAPPPRRIGRARVLVVDDERIVAQALARALQPDHSVEICTDARAALARLRAGEAFDLIFCDLMMPEMTGMELYERLSAEAEALARRMVFLTGGAFTPRARAFLDTVTNPQLEKPFDADRLRALVAEALLTAPAPPTGDR